MKHQKKKIAIFDIDGTLFRSSLVIELNKKLIAKGIFPSKAAKEIINSFLRWANRQGSYEDYIYQVVKIHAKYLRGSKEVDIMRAAREVAKEQKNKVYVYTRDLIKKIRKNYLLIAISGSPVEIVREFTKIHQFDLHWGTVMEVKNSYYTGRTLNCPADNKKAVVRDFLKSSGLNLHGSLGVGDTENDISFLEMVERPICFNPNKALYRTARRRYWPIVVERKDVIYKINN